MPIEAVHTSKKPAGFYSSGVKAGGLLFIAGQMPFDDQGRLIGEDVGDQTRQAMRNIEAVAAAAGGSLRNLVQVTVYLTDISQWREFNAAYGEVMNAAGVTVLPARAAIPVKELSRGALLEIQALAWLGS
jgi:reactive intermediate/imine deaminase